MIPFKPGVLVTFLSFTSVVFSTEYFDLSYSVGKDTVFFPGQKEFQLTKDYDRSTGLGYSAFSFCMAEHGGTHVDSPFHFFKDGWTIDQIPPSHLIDVPAVVVNVSRQAEEIGADYIVSVDDLIQFESSTGKQIPSKSVVLFYTGWSRYYWDKIRYLGYKNETEQATLSFPGISLEAAKFLSNERQIVGIGIDTPSMDPGSSQTFPVHQLLAQKQVYNIENVANLHLINSSSCNLKLFVMPVKIIGGTGSPTRVLGYCP